MYPPILRKQKHFPREWYMRTEGYLLLEVMISLLFVTGFAVAFAAYQIHAINQKRALIQQLKAMNHAHNLFEKIVFLQEKPVLQELVDDILVKVEYKPVMQYTFENPGIAESAQHILITATWQSETGNERNYYINAVI